VRDDLEQQLARLTTEVVRMGESVDGMLGTALQAFAASDPTMADEVLTADAAVDAAYEHIQHGVLAVVALHGPVGRDLRLLMALIHVSLHVERMGDYAVNVARTIKRVGGAPSDRDLAEQLSEMGARAREIGQVAVRAFAQEDADLARSVPDRDDEVDRLNDGVFGRLVRVAVDDELLPWATRMIQLTRQIERYADHAVAVAEQAVFVVTGEAVELSSHGTR
jgi:phosphate transport system protein